jgi:hypothetical protein
MRPSRLIPIAVLLAVLAGCQSRQVVHYTSPEIFGRVLDAHTHQPIANVHVRRVVSQSGFPTFDAPKGGQLLIQPPPVLTDAGGQFELASQSVFALFWSPGWWGVPVTFEHYGYETLQTNYTAVDVVSNTAAGPPVVNAGDVLLQPAAR